MTTLRNLAENINSNLPIKEHEPMSDHTTFKVGGACDFFISPTDVEELARTVKALKTENVPFFVLGGGSNIVVSDNGIKGAVVYTGNMNDIVLNGAELHCACGVTMDAVTAFCAEHGISGLETFSGLPGTVGGALYMNARCYEKSVSDVLLSAEYYDCKTDTVCSYIMSDEDWAYKKSPFQRDASGGANETCDADASGGANETCNVDATNGAGETCDADATNDADETCDADATNDANETCDADATNGAGKTTNKDTSSGAGDAFCSYDASSLSAVSRSRDAASFQKIVLKAVFRVQPNADPALVAKQNDFYRADREKKRHFAFPSAGSVFKNNRDFGSPCGKIIDEAGLRGMSVGGAQVAPWHGNFIINKGGATSADIKQLVEKIRAEVYQKRGFLLESEIIFVGK